MIDSITLFGKIKRVPESRLTFRPAVYGIVIHGEEILLTRTRSTGKYFFPGGAIELGEKIEDALRREVREETGIEVEIQKFFYFTDNFFYYDPTDEAYHNFSFFYLCKPLTYTLKLFGEIDDGEAEKPQWVSLKTIDTNNMQSFSGEVLELFKRAQSNSQEKTSQ